MSTIAFAKNNLPGNAWSPFVQRHVRSAVSAAKAAGLTVVDRSQPHDAVFYIDITPNIVSEIQADINAGRITSVSQASLATLEDKIAQKNALAGNPNVNLPSIYVPGPGDSFADVQAQIGSAFFWKNRYGRSDLTVKYTNADTYYAPLDDWYAEQVIGTPGFSVSVAIVAGEVVAAYKSTSRIGNQGAIEFQPTFGNPATDANNITSIPDTEEIAITPELTAMCAAIGTALDIEIAKVDLGIAKNGDFYLLEVNYISAYNVFKVIDNVDPYRLWMDSVVTRLGGS